VMLYVKYASMFAAMGIPPPRFFSSCSQRTMDGNRTTIGGVAGIPGSDKDQLIHTSWRQVHTHLESFEYILISI
jgi:hypothetical protein